MIFNAQTADVEEYLATEAARIGLRMSMRQPLKERLRQFARYSLLQKGFRSATEEEVDALIGLILMHLDIESSRRITRSMVKRG
jgi:hypothetical protein